jgi:hypothetical protein
LGSIGKSGASVGTWAYKSLLIKRIKKAENNISRKALLQASVSLEKIIFNGLMDNLILKRTNI